MYNNGTVRETSAPTSIKVESEVNKITCGVCNLFECVMTCSFSPSSSHNTHPLISPAFLSDLHVAILNFCPPFSLSVCLPAFLHKYLPGHLYTAGTVHTVLILKWRMTLWANRRQLIPPHYATWSGGIRSIHFLQF